jgi:uncharacterized protein (TIGR02147 family)
MPDIFAYLDYRQFLNDSIAERRKENSNFSLRYISQKAGIKSSGFLSMVLKGTRNISEKLIIELARILKLNKKERHYFRSLVYFNQAKSHSEKSHFYREILSLQKGPVRTVTQNRYEFYDKWYYSAIRELVAIYEVTDENYEMLAKVIKPVVKPGEVKSALEVLTRLGLITKTKPGVYKRTDAVITSGVSVVKPFAIQNFQLATLELAKSAYERFPREERELSTLTMSIDKTTYNLIQKKVAKLRSEIMELARSVPEPEQVYQLNMQLFPLSKRKEETDS